MQERVWKKARVTAQAKRAVIAWSMLQGDSGAGTCKEPGTGACPATGTATCTTKCIYPRPGTLPCPDTNFFGSNASGYATGSCSASGETSIGRLPWKTLGIEMLRDAYGEPLWYAVSDRFRRPGLTNAAINSDTVGTLKLYAPDGTTLLSPGGEELAAGRRGHRRHAGEMALGQCRGNAVGQRGAEAGQHRPAAAARSALLPPSFVRPSRQVLCSERPACLRLNPSKLPAAMIFYDLACAFRPGSMPRPT